MTERAPETGRLEEPVFVRGFDPENRPKWKKRPRSPWQRHFEVARQHPSVWVKVAEVKKGGCRERARVIHNDRQSIAGWLDRNCPLERWQLRVVTLADTHCDRELYLRYLYELTPEEDAEDRAQRRQVWEARQAKVRQNKADRQARARQQALEEEAAAQVRIRSRRRPGG